MMAMLVAGVQAVEVNLGPAAEAFLVGQAAVGNLPEKVDLVGLVGEVNQADLVAAVYFGSYQVDLGTDQAGGEIQAVLTFLVAA